MPYVYNRRFLDTQYGIRKDTDIFNIGDFLVFVLTDGDIAINLFRGSEGLLEVLTRKIVNKRHVM